MICTEYSKARTTKMRPFKKILMKKFFPDLAYWVKN